MASIVDKVRCITVCRIMSWGLESQGFSKHDPSPTTRHLMEETDMSHPFILGLCGTHSSFHGGMGYLTDWKASMVEQMYSMCLEVGVDWDRHYSFRPSG